MIKAWKKTRSQPGGDYRVFTVRTDTKVSPRTGKEHDFHVIESVNWVNVIAVTPARELVMIEQYRHGTNTVELEIPGGLMDAVDASPEAAGARELREETGYAGGPPQIIGRVFPNPAIMNNICHTVLVPDSRLRHPVEFDQGEDLLTRLVPIAEIPSLVAAGKIQHSLVVAALYYFELWERGQR